MRIFVAADLSARSDRAIARGYQLAKASGGELRILHIVDSELPDELRQHSLAWAKDALARECAAIAEAAGVSASVDVRTGRPTEEIVRAANPSETDLVVLGIHNTSAPGFAFLADTTAGRVLKLTLPPVLLVREEVSAPYHDVVVGVDFSVFSLTAIRQAAQVAPSACLHLVHAYHVPFQGFLDSARITEEVAYNERLEVDAFLREEMEALRERAQQHGLAPGSIEMILKEGPARQVLWSECRRLGADLLVIGTHGRQGISRTIWGSVAEDFLNSPPCDVLVIRPY